jgi:hypothetical protein
MKVTQQAKVLIVGDGAGRLRLQIRVRRVDAAGERAPVDLAARNRYDAVFTDVQARLGRLSSHPPPKARSADVLTCRSHA